MSQQRGGGTRMTSIKVGGKKVGEVRINLFLEANVTREELDAIRDGVRVSIRRYIEHFHLLADPQEGESRGS